VRAPWADAGPLASADTIVLPPTTPAGPVTGTADQVWPPSVLLNRGIGSAPCVASPPATTVPFAPELLAGRTASALMRTSDNPAIHHCLPSRLLTAHPSLVARLPQL